MKDYTQTDKDRVNELLLQNHVLSKEVNELMSQEVETGERNEQTGEVLDKIEKIRQEIEGIVHGEERQTRSD